MAVVDEGSGQVRLVAVSGCDEFSDQERADWIRALPREICGPDEIAGLLATR